MIKQFLDYAISSIIELKLKILAEIGFISGAGFGAVLTVDVIPPWLQFALKPGFHAWLIKNCAEGFIHGLAGVIASIVLASILRSCRKGYLKIKDRIKKSRLK